MCSVALICSSTFGTPESAINNQNLDVIINVLSDLNDFCRELDSQEVFNDNSETDFAKYLRTLHSKREKIGKKDLHYALTVFFDSFEMSQDEFNNLS